MSELAQTLIQGALVILTILLVPCVYRAIVGPEPAERLQAVETITTLLIGIIILLTLVQNSLLVFDIALALAAFGFIATLALARYISERRLF